jgi:wee1-like protein kinase
MYEICLGRPLPSDGQEWHTIRSGELLPLELNGTPYEMKLIIKEMMHPDPKMRPSASQLLTRKQLLSEEQKQLMAEKSKVLEANLALALQTQKLKKLTPPRTKKLIRSNTWNGSCQH